MTMTFSLNDNFVFAETVSRANFHLTANISNSELKTEDFHLFTEKLQLPEAEKNISRPRLTELLAKSSKNFSATLITGRTGTGKTALAADFARQYKKTAWFSIDSGDCDWSVFANYFAASILGEKTEKFVAAKKSSAPTEAGISKYLAEIFTNTSSNQDDSLIVLDGVHYVFDTAWFADFFNLLLYSLPPETHLLMLCRSKPPIPLWRLRSKQILNVIDEKLLALNMEETENLYKSYGLPSAEAVKAHQKSFGRISKLVNFVDKI